MMGRCKLTSICGHDYCCIECPENEVCKEQCARMDRYEYCVEDCLRKWGVDTKGSVASGQEDTD